MSALVSQELRRHWIANAERLDRKGYFAEYSAKHREEVLRKGYLGHWRPDDAIMMGQDQANRGTCFWTQQFIDDMRDRGFVHHELRDAALKILAETPPECYSPPRKLCDPPGYPFIFPGRTTGCEIYFKVQIEGSSKKPRVLFCSCHPPVKETE